MEDSFEGVRQEFTLTLKKSFIKNDFNILVEKHRLYKTTSRDLKAALDQVFRDVMLDILQDSNVEKLQKFVNYSIEACRLGMITPTMPVVLLGDIFDAITLNKCEEMFTFVENGVHIWKEDLFFSSCKNNLLRMCNDLLRRLSRTQNTVFCGRILLFLAKFFPFSERSGLNIVSEFNLENITEYGADAASSLKESIADFDTEADDKKITIDFNLYCKFWALQDFFRNPNQCYNKVQWKTFAAHASNVLSAFSSCKLEELQKKRPRLDINYTEQQVMSEVHYFAKFLTNQKLLELQLSDAKFRRCILVQFLILFQYLTSTVKFKSENFELKVDQIEWVNKMSQTVYSLLEETPPDGDKYAKIVKHILAREELWNTWKNDGCPEFKKPLPVPENTEELTDVKKMRQRRPKRLLGDVIKEATTNNKYYMGSNELTKLWNLCPDNLEACKAKERDFLPSLDTYFAEAIEQLDPAAMVEDKYKKVNDGNFGWRGLRLFARRSPQFFTYNNNHISKLPDYLEIMIKKIAKEKQDRSGNNASEQQDVEMEEEILKGTEEEQATNDEALQGEDFSPAPNAPQEEKLEITVSPEQINAICEKLGENWKKLAKRLGISDNDIEYYETENDTLTAQARNMLQVWFEDDTDASLENLCYFLDGLSLHEVADLIKKEYINTM